MNRKAQKSCDKPWNCLERFSWNFISLHINASLDFYDLALNNFDKNHFLFRELENNYLEIYPSWVIYSNKMRQHEHIQQMKISYLILSSLAHLPTPLPPHPPKKGRSKNGIPWFEITGEKNSNLTLIQLTSNLSTSMSLFLLVIFRNGNFAWNNSFCKTVPTIAKLSLMSPASKYWQIYKTDF